MQETAHKTKGRWAPEKGSLSRYLAPSMIVLASFAIAIMIVCMGATSTYAQEQEVASASTGKIQAPASTNGSPSIAAAAANTFEVWIKVYTSGRVRVFVNTTGTWEGKSTQGTVESTIPGVATKFDKPLKNGDGTEVNIVDNRFVPVDGDNVSASGNVGGIPFSTSVTVRLHGPVFATIQQLESLANPCPVYNGKGHTDPKVIVTEIYGGQEHPHEAFTITDPDWTFQYPRPAVMEFSVRVQAWNQRGEEKLNQTFDHIPGSLACGPRTTATPTLTPTTPAGTPTQVITPTVPVGSTPTPTVVITPTLPPGGDITPTPGGPTPTDVPNGDHAHILPNTYQYGACNNGHPNEPFLYYTGSWGSENLPDGWKAILKYKQISIDGAPMQTLDKPVQVVGDHEIKIRVNVRIEDANHKNVRTQDYDISAPRLYTKDAGGNLVIDPELVKKYSFVDSLDPNRVRDRGHDGNEMKDWERSRDYALAGLCGAPPATATPDQPPSGGDTCIDSNPNDGVDDCHPFRKEDHPNNGCVSYWVDFIAENGGRVETDLTKDKDAKVDVTDGGSHVTIKGLFAGRKKIDYVVNYIWADKTLTQPYTLTPSDCVQAASLPNTGVNFANLGSIILSLLVVGAGLAALWFGLVRPLLRKRAR